MSDQDDEFLRSIPAFLRRTNELPPRKPTARPRKPAARPRAAAVTSKTAPKDSPVTASPPVPSSETAETAPPTPAPQAVIATPKATPAGPRGRLALAVHNPDFDNLELDAAAEDIPVQLHLPRSVARQLRALAEEKGTTQRAIVLRALRLAGLSVPERRDPRPTDLPRADAR